MGEFNKKNTPPPPLRPRLVDGREGRKEENLIIRYFGYGTLLIPQMALILSSRRSSP